MTLPVNSNAGQGELEEGKGRAEIVLPLLFLSQHYSVVKDGQGQFGSVFLSPQTNQTEDDFLKTFTSLILEKGVYYNRK